MPRDPRGPRPERACEACGRTYRPTSGRGGGRPSTRCETCRTSVRQLRPSAAAPSTGGDDLTRLLSEARARSLVDDDIRQRLLDIVHLLDGENAAIGNATVTTCTRALRELCGYGANAQREGQQAG